MKIAPCGDRSATNSFSVLGVRSVSLRPVRGSEKLPPVASQETVIDSRRSTSFRADVS
jgi:hypothetical protein